MSLSPSADSFDHLNPLHGRDGELDAIRSALRSVRNDAGTVISIEGTHGMGKTRLLQEIRHDMRDFDILESASKACEFDRLVSFGYLMPVFGAPPIDFVRDLTHDDNPYLLRDWLCSKILPGEPGNQRKNKAAILLDDLHWADETSLIALYMSLPWLLTKPVALVLTWNTSRPDLQTSRLFDKPDQSARQLLDKLEQRGSVRVNLPPLSTANSLNIARDLMSGALQPATIDMVSQAGGNPQLIVELIQGMREEPEVLERSAGSRDFSSARIPDRLHEAVRSRIDSLNERTGLVLRVAALIGQSFSFSLLRSRMTVNSVEDEISIIRSIHEAKRAGLLRLDGNNIVFRNPLVWQSLAVGGGVLAKDETGGSAAAHREDASEQDASEPTESWKRLRARDSKSGPEARSGPEASRESPAAVLPAEISPMQWKIAELASEGKTNRQIARQLYISPHTVDTHLRRLFRKLSISSRIELARIFISEEL